MAKEVMLLLNMLSMWGTDYTKKPVYAFLFFVHSVFGLLSGEPAAAGCELAEGTDCW